MIWQITNNTSNAMKQSELDPQAYNWGQERENKQSVPSAGKLVIGFKRGETRSVPSAENS